MVANKTFALDSKVPKTMHFLIEDKKKCIIILFFFPNLLQEALDLIENITKIFTEKLPIISRIPVLRYVLITKWFNQFEWLYKFMYNLLVEALYYTSNVSVMCQVSRPG
jgi:hypothetical protein